LRLVVANVPCERERPIGIQDAFFELKERRRLKKHIKVEAGFPGKSKKNVLYLTLFAQTKKVSLLSDLLY